ncbi:MAG: transposase [Candidatus Aminicenantes bacterium]|nr:transposase [Candidatus Aminicenantes bacterium]
MVASHFSHTGRPGTDSRLFIDLMLLKYMTGVSDREILESVLENPYMQMFCGFERFVTRRMLDTSTLTRLRKKVGVEFFRDMEERTYRLLIERRIIRAKGMLVDTTVFPENVKYPSDVGSLNMAREWLVKRVTAMGGRLGHRYRTYKCTARKVYLNFTKKKAKRKKTVEKAKRQMLNFVRRLIGQFHDAKTKLSQLSWLALIRINQNPGLNAEVQKAARMEKNKKKHQPTFVYYRLLQGVKNLLAGVKRMFLFRWKRRARKVLLKTTPPMLPFLISPTALTYDMEYGL